MRRISTFICGMLVGAVLIYAALHYHLIRAADGFHLVAKTETTLAGAFVDIREFGPRDWLEHPQIAVAIVNADQEDLMRSATDQTLLNGMDRLLGMPDDR